MDAKEAAAARAVEFVEDGMTLGLGTGSTSFHFINLLGAHIARQDWKVRGVATSERSRVQALGLGIPILELSDVRELDLAVDGADESDASLALIKGGGGALLREKLVAAAARQFVVVCDSTKLKDKLGAFPLPVAVVPFGWGSTAARLERFGAPASLRRKSGGDDPYITDDGLYILDMKFGTIEDPAELEQQIKQITGVVDVGLFIGLASRLILGYDDGHTAVIERPA